MTGIVGQDPFSRSGTLGAFLSKGIDDNADANAITIASDESVTLSGDFIPSETLSNRNMVVNGGMQIWQRSDDITASDGSNEGYNSIDRWYFNFNSSCPGTLDIDRFADAPNGFSYSMRLKCNATGTPASSSTDYVLASTTLEAQDLQRLCYGTADAKVTTLSWYMKSVNFTTPIGIYLETFDGTKEYYHVNATPTTSWARYSVTIPKSTSATITNDNGAGLLIGFVLSGSTDGSLAEANDSSAWSTTQKIFRSNQTNFFSNTSNELYIAGLQFELGSNATPFEHKSYGDELRRCQRYYFKITNETGGENTFGVGVMDGTTACQWYTNFPVTMRIAPTAIETSGTAGDYSLRATHTVTCNGVPAHYHCTKQSAAGSAGIASGTYFTSRGGGILRAVDNDAYLAWSAEL